jgi:hypothetical protein
MADPSIIGSVITGLVGALSAYMTYRVGMKQAEQNGTSKPEQSAEAKKGETALATIQQAVQQHGDDKDRNALAQFEADPEDYRDALERKLLRLAEANPAFAQQLQTLAQQAGVQGSGVQGNVNISGQGKVYGTATGVNTGTISGTYNINDDKDT